MVDSVAEFGVELPASATTQITSPRGPSTATDAVVALLVRTVMLKAVLGWATEGRATGETTNADAAPGEPVELQVAKVEVSWP